jgi:hypothetical protein
MPSWLLIGSSVAAYNLHTHVTVTLRPRGADHVSPHVDDYRRGCRNGDATAELMKWPLSVRSRPLPDQPHGGCAWTLRVGECKRVRRSFCSTVTERGEPKFSIRRGAAGGGVCDSRQKGRITVPGIACHPRSTASALAGAGTTLKDPGATNLMNGTPAAEPVLRKY